MPPSSAEKATEPAVRYAELCTDLDGPGPLPAAGTGLTIYVVAQIVDVEPLPENSTFDMVFVRVRAETWDAQGAREIFTWAVFGEFCPRSRVLSAFSECST